MIRYRQHDCADEFGEELRIVGADAVPTARTCTPDDKALYKDYSTTTAMLPSGMLFHCTSAGPMLGCGGTTKGYFGLVMPWVESKPAIHQGVEMSRHGISLYGPNTRHVATYNADSAFTVCALDDQRVHTHLSHLLGRDDAHLGEDTYSLLNLRSDTRHGFEETVTRIVNLRNGMRETNHAPEIMASIEDRILNLIAEAIGSASNQSSPTMPRHSARLQMVSACWELSKRMLDVNLTLNDLCVAADASARVLQYAFLEFAGTSPNVFLRNHRLTKAHRMLLSGEAKSVKEAAYSCGFTELGRFSGRYRALFGCYPRETLGARRG